MLKIYSQNQNIEKTHTRIFGKFVEPEAAEV